jgi:polysaccharide export outer membrane protein
MKFTRIFLLLAFPLYLVSCRTQQKMPYYLENVTDTSGKGVVASPEMLIQKDDLLSIQINSIATDPRADAMWNQSIIAASGQPTGFLVDRSGNIEHFRLGTIHVEGMTKQQLAAEIKKRLTEPVELLRDPTVIIRFLNFKITVLGQVGHEGVLTIPGERLTILEAVGLAGGITDYGKKDSLRIMREYNGKRETGTISLSDPKLFESPYYNLMQNDVIIVQATSRKMKDADQARVAQKLSFAFTLVTVAATLANIFIRN